MITTRHYVLVRLLIAKETEGTLLDEWGTFREWERAALRRLKKRGLVDYTLSTITSKNGKTKIQLTEAGRKEATALREKGVKINPATGQPSR